ncbi:MAG: phosphotransferase family protein [Streptococcaceae bacterium]|jgi:thiamine kinase-like enzyme|nr:phosphotransferase family protein [Streptococcaceae bacterium]
MAIREEPAGNWELKPIDSRSGNSYFGRIGTQQVFVKRNPCPILPNLAAEGLTPKLLWSRPTDSGDILTAQPWIVGHTLDKDWLELVDAQVGQLLAHLHTNRGLRDALSTFDRTVQRPAKVLEELITHEGSFVGSNNFLRQVADEMSTAVPALNNLNIVVVHGDVNPSNWLKEDATGKIYLIDWDTVSLGDAFYDIGYLLSHFVSRSRWDSLLAEMGYNRTDIAILAKIRWYGELSFMQQIENYLQGGDTFKANNEILGLRRFIASF